MSDESQAVNTAFTVGEDLQVACEHTRRAMGGHAATGIAHHGLPNMYVVFVLQKHASQLQAVLVRQATYARFAVVSAAELGRIGFVSDYMIPRLRRVSGVSVDAEVWSRIYAYAERICDHYADRRELPPIAVECDG